MKPLPISLETVREWFAYKDGRLVWAKRLGRSGVGAPAGSKKLDGYVTVKFRGHSYQAHRFIWMLHHGETELQVDHINGVRDDNRIENLRAVTHAENQRCKKSAWGEVPYRGVQKERATGIYVAKIFVDGRQRVVGKASTPEEAHAAWMEAARKYWGEFAPEARP